MIETDKMLHLRRYMTLFRKGTKSRVVPSHLPSSFSSSLSREIPNFATRKGYIFCYAHHDLSRTQLRPRKNYTAVGIRTFGTTISQSTSIDDIDDKLMSLCDDVKKGRQNTDDLKEVIRICNKPGYKLHHDTGVLLLKCCGNLGFDLETTERQYLTDQVWDLAKKNSEGLTLEYYNTLLDVYMKNSISVDSKKFLADMNVEPDKNTYHLLLNIVANIGNSNHLQDIISVIKKKNVIIDEDTFNTLVQIYTTNGNIAQAEHVIKLMQDTKLPMDKAYIELACGYAKLGDIPNLVKILNDESQNITDINLLRLIKVLSMSDNGRYIPVVLNFLMASALTIKSQISKMIIELIRADRATDAHTIINCLAINDKTKDVAKSFVNSFLNELIMLNESVDDITRYAADFVDSGCEPLALINVAESSLKLGRENLSLAIFETMREKGLEVRSHYYWPLLAIAHYNQGEAKIFSLIKFMMDTEVWLDSDTLLHYVYPYVNTANPIIVLHKLMINGVPSSIAYTPLISFLLSHNRMQDIKLLCTHNRQYKIHYRELIRPLVRAYIATKDVESCVLLLTIFSRGPNFIALFLKMLLDSRQLTFPVEDLKIFLEEFKKRSAGISKRDAAILKNNLSNENFKLMEDVNIFKLIDNLVDINLKESALSFTIHPMLMNTRQLACHLVELNSKNLSTRTVLRRLLEAYCVENNLKKAEEIKQEFNARQYEWTPGIKTYLFELYTKRNKLKEAETLLSDLQTMSSNFQIDNVKLVLLATALVNADKPKEAFEVINSNNVNLKTDAQKYCYILLQTLAESKYYSHTKDMLNLLLEKEYCKINTELLRPLVAIPLKRNDVQGTLHMFITCVDKYKKAPLALEVLVMLLQQKDSSKLHNAEAYIEKVYNILVNLYDSVRANTLLVLALATLDKTQELKIILQKQKISVTCLFHYFNYAKRNNNADSLFKLFKAIPDSNNIEQVAISEMLLFIYNKTGDCNNAIELWKLMCEKNIKPSEQFKNIFIQFLRANKISLPPEFEQDKNEINVNQKI